MNNDYLLREELRSAGYTGSINQAIRNVLTDAGITGQLNEAMRQFFNELGYTGHYSEQMKQWKAAGYPLTAFNQNLDFGFMLANQDNNTTGVVPYNTGGVYGSNGSTTYDEAAGTITFGVDEDFLVFANNFPIGGTGGSIQFSNQGQVSNAVDNRMATGASYGNFAHGHSAGSWGIGAFTSSETIRNNLINDGRSASQWIGAMAIPDGSDYFFARDNSDYTNMTGWTTVSSSSNWNGTTGDYTVPEDGYYLVIYSSWALGAGTATLNESILRVNGLRPAGAYHRTEGNSSHYHKVVGFNPMLLYLEAGDVVDLIASGADQADGRFGIIQIPASMVMFSAHTSGHVSTGSETILTGWTERFDPNDTFNTSTGLFTAPKDGSYVFFGTGETWHNGATETRTVLSTPNYTLYARGYEAFPHREPTCVIGIDTLTEGQNVNLKAMGQSSAANNFSAIRIK